MRHNFPSRYDIHRYLREQDEKTNIKIVGFRITFAVGVNCSVEMELDNCSIEVTNYFVEVAEEKFFDRHNCGKGIKFRGKNY